MPDTELRKVFEHAEYPQKPQNYGDHNDRVQDAFDLTLHGDETVDQPEQNTDYSECENDSDERHIAFSCFVRESFSMPRSQRNVVSAMNRACMLRFL
jgi:hypothetical protein